MSLTKRIITRRPQQISPKEYVIDYISYFDIVEQINTYQFLEAYNLPYENYDKTVEIFKNVLKLYYAFIQKRTYIKFGMRKPSIKKSLKARTTGKEKRQIKKALIPGYGKKV